MAGWLQWEFHPGDLQRAFPASPLLPPSANILLLLPFAGWPLLAILLLVLLDPHECWHSLFQLWKKCLKPSLVGHPWCLSLVKIPIFSRQDFLELLVQLLASAYSAGSGQDEAPTNTSNTQRTESGHFISLITISRQQQHWNRNTQESFPLSDSVREWETGVICKETSFEKIKLAFFFFPHKNLD